MNLLHWSLNLDLLELCLSDFLLHSFGISSFDFEDFLYFILIVFSPLYTPCMYWVEAFINKIFDHYQ